MHHRYLLRLLAALCAARWSLANDIIDDNYCDRVDGSDEPHTAACAGVLKAPHFFCRGSGFLNITIPLSRVQDGVCDCCDGEDEVGSPFFAFAGDPANAVHMVSGISACPETCSDHLSQLKMETLASYKHISAGLRAKADAVNILNRKKLREKQSYDGLLREYTDIQKLYYQIKYWLERDTKVESTLRFSELRSRVRKCADGFFESCDYFHDGSNAMYPPEREEDLLYDFPELWDEQGPLPDHQELDSEEEEDDYDDDNDGGGGSGDRKERKQRHVGNLDPSKIGNSLHRKKLDTVSEQIDEVIKKNQAKDKMHSQMNGPQRIENSFCAFEEVDSVGFLGGEESLRVHKNVKQYLDWVTGKGGRAARKLTVEQTRAKTTLFGAYLDSGSSGYAVGLQVLFEAVGLVLSPVTVAYTQWTLFYSKSKKSLYRRAQSCVRQLGNMDEDLDFLRSDRLFGGDDAGYADSLPCNNLVFWPYRAILEVFDDSSPVAAVLQFFDYNNYNWFMTHVVSRVAPRINANMWYFRIIQQTPYYYFRYYFGDGASKLPVYRNACILREGLRVARLEAHDLREKIAAKKQQVEAEGGEVDAELGADGRITSADSSGILATLQKSVSFGDSSRDEGVDFGPDGSWLALNNTCLTRTEGQYVYKVCAFADVYQDRVKLGTFSHWGDKPLGNVKQKETSESKMMAFKNRIHNKHKEKMKEASDYLTNLVSSGGTGGKTEGASSDKSSSNGSDKELSYTKQYYADGVACHNGIVRHAVVEFQCAAFADIVDVVEYEMCGYALTVNTPIACTRAMEEAVLRKLQQLDVYGYGTAPGSGKEGGKRVEKGGGGAATSAANKIHNHDNEKEKDHKKQKKEGREKDRHEELNTAKISTKGGDTDTVLEMEAGVDVVQVKQLHTLGEKEKKNKKQEKKPYRVTFNP